MDYASTLPIPKESEEKSPPKMEDDDEGGALDSPFMTHHKALRHVLHENHVGQHVLSHAAGVLHDLISDRMPQSDAELGRHVADLLHKRGIHRHDQMTDAEGGSFWSSIGKGISKAWKSTTKFIGAHAKDIGKKALDIGKFITPVIASAMGAPEAIPVIEGAIGLGQKAIGGAMPLPHLVGALKDLSHAHCPHSKAKLLHKDFLLTERGQHPSPILAAMHFAHNAAPHISKGIGL